MNICESGSSNGVIFLPNDDEANNDAIDAGGMFCTVASREKIIEITAKRGTWKQTDWLALAKEFKDSTDDYKARLRVACPDSAANFERSLTADFNGEHGKA